MASRTALGRAGLAKDIGGVIAFLCSEDGGRISGQRIEVSGGMNFQIGDFLGLMPNKIMKFMDRLKAAVIK